MQVETCRYYVLVIPAVSVKVINGFVIINVSLRQKQPNKHKLFTAAWLIRKRENNIIIATCSMLEHAHCHQQLGDILCAKSRLWQYCLTIRQLKRVQQYQDVSCVVCYFSNVMFVCFLASYYYYKPKQTSKTWSLSYSCRGR